MLGDCQKLSLLIPTPSLCSIQLSKIKTNPVILHFSMSSSKRYPTSNWPHSSFRKMPMMLLPYQKYILGSKKNRERFYIFGNAHHVLYCSTFCLKIGSKVFFASHTVSIEANHENKEFFLPYFFRFVVIVIKFYDYIRR
jgi:hypothetical protein